MSNRYIVLSSSAPSHRPRTPKEFEQLNQSQKAQWNLSLRSTRLHILHFFHHSVLSEEVLEENRWGWRRPLKGQVCKVLGQSIFNMCHRKLSVLWYKKMHQVGFYLPQIQLFSHNLKVWPYFKIGSFWTQLLDEVITVMQTNKEIYKPLDANE